MVGNTPIPNILNYGEKNLPNEKSSRRKKISENDIIVEITTALKDGNVIIGLKFCKP